MAPTKLIIDTDPGNDDMLAMLYALSSKPEEIEIPLISVTYGNVDAENCLRNVVTMFSVIEKEMTWRKSKGLPEGFETLKKTKPVVAVGANAPLGDQRIMADYFHGRDGLAGVHTTHPHFTPAETWRHLFDRPQSDSTLSKTASNEAGVEPSDLPTGDLPSDLFTPSKELSWKLILKILRENPPNTVSITTIGPMTNLALAASEDVTTVLRAKQIIVMGGAVNKHGNITPLAEFNTFADAHAAAYVYSLTSPNPSSTAPLRIAPAKAYLEGGPHDPEAAPLRDPPTKQFLDDYYSKNEAASKTGNSSNGNRLNVVLVPLDITEEHLMFGIPFHARTSKLADAGSPLAAWMKAWGGATLLKSREFNPNRKGDDLFQLHDPMCVWYAIDGERNASNWKVQQDVDLRVETAGQWTRGACVIDRRGYRSKQDEDMSGHTASGVADDVLPELAGDHGGWLSTARGNRLRWCVGSPGTEVLPQLLLDTILPLPA